MRMNSSSEMEKSVAANLRWLKACARSLFDCLGILMSDTSKRIIIIELAGNVMITRLSRFASLAVLNLGCCELIFRF